MWAVVYATCSILYTGGHDVFVLGVSTVRAWPQQSACHGAVTVVCGGHDHTCVCVRVCAIQVTTEV